jgi:hypothetical protein
VKTRIQTARNWRTDDSMCGRYRQESDSLRNRPGVVLLITLVILVILSTLAYTLSAQVAARRHRDRFIIDYAQAQYACASAMKYALASLNDLQPALVSDPNQPDFSDVFAMTEPQYQALLAQVTTQLGSDDELLNEMEANKRAFSSDANDANDLFAMVPTASVKIPGPYGPPWPLVTEPLEFEIGSAKVTIEIEDENAKYPLGWALIQEEKLKAEASAGFVTFCEWMGYLPDEIKNVREDLTGVAKVRPFQIEFKAMSVPAAAPTSLRSRVTRTRPTSTKSTVQRTARTTVTVTEQMDQQSSAFAKLFHSSLIDTDIFARPRIESDTRDESAMKYLGLWATRQVNINSAPRHVLEAALSFGSIADAPKIAEAIIQRRRVKPFSDIEELKKDIFRYGAAIEKCQPFITTASTVFTVRVTAVSGVARSVAVAGVSKEARKVKRIAVISD